MQHVASFMEVWIEMKNCIITQDYRSVASFSEARIEICKSK